MKRSGKAAARRVRIRPAKPADAPALRALRLEALERHPEAFIADSAAEAARPAAHWEELAATGDENDEAAVYVAEAGTALAGMAGISRKTQPKTRHSAVVWGVYVRPEWRGQGIGEALVRRCLDWGRRIGLRVVRIAAVNSNAAAIRCYERCGFTPYGIEPEAVYMDGKAYDDVLMAIRL
jgi:RimJ/RimL family protein N-acetyltransferase